MVKLSRDCKLLMTIIGMSGLIDMEACLANAIVAGLHHCKA